MSPCTLHLAVLTASFLMLQPTVAWFSVDSMPATRTDYTLYVMCDDSAQVYINGAFLGSVPSWTIVLQNPVSLKVGDVLAFKADDIGVNYGLAFALVDATGTTYVSSLSSHIRAISSTSYYEQVDAWKQKAYDSCGWSYANYGTSSCGIDYMYCNQPNSPYTLGATSLWAAGVGTFSTAYVRFVVGGTCSPCQCGENDGCPSAYGNCQGCMFTFDDPLGDKSKFCYNDWTMSQCEMYGTDYFWCGSNF